jgi:hypothetical protein
MKKLDSKADAAVHAADATIAQANEILRQYGLRLSTRIGKATADEYHGDPIIAAKSATLDADGRPDMGRRTPYGDGFKGVQPRNRRQATA